MDKNILINLQKEKSHKMLADADAMTEQGRWDIAAKWHGYYEYLHPFRDGNGRTGRLLSNFILLRAGHPLLIIRLEDRSAYISALKQIRTEGTDEHLVLFFFKTAISRMKSELSQKHKNSLPTMFF